MPPWIGTADHRVSVRAGPGDTDRVDGRNGPRGTAGNPDQGPEVLESTRRIDTIVLDKTGTITTGTMTLLDVITADDERPDEVLGPAGALEGSAEPPTAKAIAKGAREKVGALPVGEDFANIEG